MILEALHNPTHKDLGTLLTQNTTLKECYKSFKYNKHDECIATIDEFTTFKNIIKTARMNVAVNNILKILDAYQRDDALLNIHNEIHDIFVKAMQAEEDNMIEIEMNKVEMK